MKLIPYIMFNGNAEEALNFYKDLFKGEIQNLSRYENAPVDSTDLEKGKIMHSILVFGDNTIMISDAMGGQTEEPGGNVHLSVDVPDTSELKIVFDKMSEGGNVTMPLEDTFWGATFGMLTDKFGIKWMFNHDKK